MIAGKPETRLITGKPEATLHVNNKITSMFRWQIEFQVAMPVASGHVTGDEQDYEYVNMIVCCVFVLFCTLLFIVYLAC